MRSAIVAAAFAAGALAVPLMERDVVWETDIVYATQFVTVTQGDVAPTPAPEAESTTSKKHYGHGNRKSKTSSLEGYAWTSSWATTWTESSAPAPTSVQEQAPPAYSAPAYSSEEPAPAPSSYEAPTSSQAPPSSAPASSASDAKPTDYKSFVVHHHNVHRFNHSAPAVKWSDSLAATAQKIGESCNYAHDTEMDGGGYGQNIAAGVKADNVSAVITELFYNGEVSLYGDQYLDHPTAAQKKDWSPDMTNFHEWGHFTQIVWVDTTEVGCATVDCSAKGLSNTGGNVAPYFTVCNYGSAGNMGGAYALNVLRPRGDATCSWDDGT